MGNQHNSDDFNPQDWTKIETDPNLPNLWQNNYSPWVHIEQYLVTSKNQEQLNLQKQFFFERKNHPYWVSAYYFQQQKNNSVCMLQNAAHIYIQKIPIQIEDLRQLSLSDLIHTYNQCLQGFKTLSQILGFFRVTGKFIGINERGTVKVWAGSQWSKIGVILNQITEQQMVESIFQVLDKFSLVLRNQLPISITNFLHRNYKKLTFNFALQELKNFALQFNQGIIPNRIQTLNAESSDMFFDPLIRSQHHLLLQSKYLSNPQASNSSFYKYKGRDQNNRIKLKEIKQQSSSVQKLSFSKNSKSSFLFFTCMNVQQEKKPSKLFTKEEMIKHYADYYQIDHLQKIPQNNIKIRQNTNVRPQSLYLQKPTINQRGLLKQAQIFQNQYHVPVQQYNNSKPYSFQVLKKQNQANYNHNQIKVQNQLHRSDNYAQKNRGKSLDTTSQRQFIRFNPKISLGLLNNSQNPQLSSQKPTNLPPQKSQALNSPMNISESKVNIYYQRELDRKPLIILQRNIKEPSKCQLTQRIQRSYV